MRPAAIAAKPSGPEVRARRLRESKQTAERVTTRSEAANAARGHCREAKQAGGLRPAPEGSKQLQNGSLTRSVSFLPQCFGNAMLIACETLRSRPG
jgi:hypothetical protein